MEGKEPLWLGIINFRYGDALHCIHGDIAENKLAKFSLWWRDVRALCRIKIKDKAWFLDSMSFKLGDGNRTGFWNHNWVGNLTINLSSQTCLPAVP